VGEYFLMTLMLCYSLGHETLGVYFFERQEHDQIFGIYARTKERLFQGSMTKNEERQIFHSPLCPVCIEVRAREEVSRIAALLVKERPRKGMLAGPSSPSIFFYLCRQNPAWQTRDLAHTQSNHQARKIYTVQVRHATTLSKAFPSSRFTHSQIASISPDSFKCGHFVLRLRHGPALKIHSLLCTRVSEGTLLTKSHSK